MVILRRTSTWIFSVNTTRHFACMWARQPYDLSEANCSVAYRRGSEQYQHDTKIELETRKLCCSGR